MGILRAHILGMERSHPWGAVSETESPQTSCLALHCCQRGFCLGQPERHLHLSVHLDRRGQFGSGLLGVPHLAIQDAKATVAVGMKWTHAELIG
jgi:hypothetical protein